MLKKRAKGSQGSWFATVEGELLPCVTERWMSGLHYHEPYIWHGYTVTGHSPAYADRYIDAIKAGKVILTQYKEGPLDQHHVSRKKYVAVFEVTNVVVVNGDGIRFQFVKRLYDLV